MIFVSQNQPHYDIYMSHVKCKKQKGTHYKMAAFTTTRIVCLMVKW